MGGGRAGKKHEGKPKPITTGPTRAMPPESGPAPGAPATKAYTVWFTPCGTEPATSFHPQRST